MRFKYYPLLCVRLNLHSRSVKRSSKKIKYGQGKPLPALPPPSESPQLQSLICPLLMTHVAQAPSELVLAVEKPPVELVKAAIEGSDFVTVRLQC